MARIDDLIDQVADDDLRHAISSAVADLRSSKKFGLVFEEHIPETVALPGLPISVGSLVQQRKDISEGRTYRVVEISGAVATIKSLTNDGTIEKIPLDELHAVKRFGEVVFPGLASIGSALCGPDDRPCHVVINAENYDAVQLLGYVMEGQVDVLLLDPPFNTGDRTWRYSNRYVDGNDSYRHSKWLSFMEKRLRIAQRLLKPDSVVIVYIDEHEVHHLRTLLEQVYPQSRLQMVTIVNNAAGVSQGGFYRVEEYAIFCFFGDAGPVPGPDDYLSDENREKPEPVWFSLIRYGGVNALPSKRPGLVYPIAVDTTRDRIAGVGKTLKDLRDTGELPSSDLDKWSPDQVTLDGHPVVWPYRPDGSMGTWQLNPEKLMALAEEGFVRVRRRRRPLITNQWSLSYVKQGNRDRVANGQIPVLGREPEGALILGTAGRQVIPKTVWKRAKHDAGKWGSRFLREFLGSAFFDYPKSPYGVKDVLRTVVGDRRDAVIVDFFAGSGTTLHSTLMLNAEDDGARRCVLVTNNEVSEAEARRLIAEDKYPGDPEFEQHGIFEGVTMPRCVSAVTGVRPDGKPVEGRYDTGALYAEGFPENIHFFKLEYLSPDEIDLRRQYTAIAPLLWLKAGGVGSWDSRPGSVPWSMPEGCMYAVLFDEARFSEFMAEREARPDLTHLFFVTDSPSAYAEMRARTPPGLKTSMLYRDYLRSFEIAAGGKL